MLFSGIESKAQVTKLQDYQNLTSPAIGTFQGINFREAGFSGLYPIPNTSGKEFWTTSDRGPNVDCASANPAGCQPTYDKLYAFPSYAPKIHRIRIDGTSIEILQTITVKRPNGSGASGIINPTGLGSTAAEVASTDTVLDCANFNLKTTPKDTFGIDPEGIIVDKDGNFWLCEEGGATIWKLNANGVLIKRFTPYANLAGAQSVDTQIDTVFKYRKNNRGFEGISIAPNGKIYAIIQSPILYPNTTAGEASRVHRILEIDPATNAQRMIVYLNDGIIGTGSNQIRLRDWKIGDMAAINDSTFLVLEAAARGTTDIKRLYRINIGQATSVHSGLYGGVTLEALADSTGLANNGIKAVTKTLVMDLLANGWPSALDKAEGLSIINDSTIAICNDNDYGQTSPSANGIATATANTSHLITFRLSGASKLTNYTTPVFPPVAPVSMLLDFQNNSSAPIGTFMGVNFREAGFSALYPIPNTNGKEFWTCSDRGVNVDCANANPAGCHPTYDKLYGFPSYVPKIHRIRIQNGELQILQSITIKRPNGSGASGIINPTGLGSTAAEVASTDTVLDCANFNSKTTPKDTFGIDPEGLIVDKDGNFWLSEEGGATIWKLNANGVLIKRFTPYANLAGAQSVDAQIDPVFKYRKNNRGFEGISIAPNGKIYAIIQSPILYPNKSAGEASRVHRILEIDPATNAQRMLVYLNDGIIGTGSNQIRLRDWKIGDMAAINDSTFLVLEAAARGTSDIKRLYQININQAPAVHSGLYGGVTLEALTDSTGLANNGIKPVSKKLVMDLLANGWPAVLDKAEGIAIINDSTIAICNDNDFGQSSPNEDGIPIPTNNLSHLITFRLTGASKLANYKTPPTPILSQGTTGVSSSKTPYLTAAMPGVSLTSIITTGDAVNGYKMAGTPDGLGAFDNGNGTFTLLMNHEFGNSAGAIRAHGSKGAFVSKWVINKNDLAVVSGSDLIKRVNVWSNGAYTLLDSANASALTAFNRFCSADLPAVSAFFNAATGLGTQERIFMNGEEAGDEGRAFAHIVTGANAGTSYHLPALGRFSWENAVASPTPSDKTIVAGMDDSTPGQVYIYVGTKTNSGTDVDKAGLTNGILYGVAVKGLATEISASIPAANTRFSLIDMGNIKDSTGAYLNARSNNLGVTTFLRPEDGAWDPSNPNDLYFATTNAITSPSRLWRLRFNDIKTPEVGGTITAVLDGTEGQKMLDNIAIDQSGHILLVEDVGNNVHLGRTWQYTIATDKFEVIASHDSTRFLTGAANYLTQDEEASGILDVQDILGAGNFLIVDQAHYAQPGELVEGGQLLKLFNPATANGIQLKNIAQARAMSTNDTVKVQGIVTRAWGRFIYIQDSTGAICVNQASGNMVDSIISGALRAGDKVEVVGVRTNDNNYAQIAIAAGSFKENNRVSVLVRNQTLPLPKHLTLKQLNANGELYESQLVRVVNLKTAATGTFAPGTNYTIWDGSTSGDTSALRILSATDTEIDDAPALAIPAGRFTFEGTLTQFCSSPSSGCATGYQLQGVRKHEIIAQPALSAFNLVTPVTNTRITTKAGNTTPVEFKWNASTHVTSYKWLITTAAGSFTAPWLSLASASAGTDSTFIYLRNAFDTLAAQKGIAKGDSVLLKWTAVAYLGQDSMMASQSNTIWIVRERDIIPPVLNPFNLLTPANNSRIEVDQNDNTPVVITWSASVAGASYKWMLDAQNGNFSNPWATQHADSNGTDTKLTLTSGAIDAILDGKSIIDGDSAEVIWTVRAYKSSDSLQASQTFNLTVVRKKTVGIKEVLSNASLNLYPNPTSANTILAMQLPSAATVQVSISDIQGKRVTETIEKHATGGEQEIELPTAALQTGIYFVRIHIGDQSTQVKLVVIH